VRVLSVVRSFVELLGGVVVEFERVIPVDERFATNVHGGLV
jgi:hypothetical protein